MIHVKGLVLTLDPQGMEELRDEEERQWGGEGGTEGGVGGRKGMEEEGEEEKEEEGGARIGRRKKRQEEEMEERRRMRRWRRSDSSRSICQLLRGLVCKAPASTSRHQKPHLSGCLKLNICPLQGSFLEWLPTCCPFQLVARNRASSLLTQHQELSLGRIGHGQ